MRFCPPLYTCGTLKQCGVDDEGIGAYRKSIPVPRIPLRVDHSPSRGSTLTDASASDSGYSELSEAESPIAKPAQTNTDALPRFNYLKGRSTETFSDISLLPASDPARELERPSHMMSPNLTDT